jgi:hypothetical protein
MAIPSDTKSRVADWLRPKGYRKKAIFAFPEKMLSAGKIRVG